MTNAESENSAPRRVLVTGADGMLGGDVCAAFETQGWAVLPSSRADVDVTDEARTRERIVEARPAAVAHLAGYTNVDDAEDEPDRCFAVNADGARNVALACQEIGARMLFISTDYVFDGRASEPYDEHAPVNPQSVYGISKAKGEEHVAGLARRHTIVRTSWLHGLGDRRRRRNFVEAILAAAQTRKTLKVVNDQIGSPTFAFDLAPRLVGLVEAEADGVFHVTNAGACSWFDLARAALRLAGVRDVAVEPVSTADYGAKAIRPAYSVLANRRLLEFAFDPMPPWEESLKTYFDLRRAGE